MYPRISQTIIAALTVGSAACGGKDDGAPDPTPAAPLQCTSAGYVAFDPANHASQDQRLGAYKAMLAQIDLAKADVGLAAAKFAEARRLYESTASLAEKVRGRKDLHLAGEPVVGLELHGTLDAALSAGAAATSTLAVDLAKQAIDKTLIGFFYLSVYYEMRTGAKVEWDEAYGYYGSGPEDLEGTRRGLASVAAKRDAANGTNLAAEIFDGLVAGSCELAKAGAPTPALEAITADVDRRLTKVLAYSAGHEAFELRELQAELGTNPAARALMRVKLAELDPYFRAFEGQMVAKGGASAERAGRIRSRIDAAKADASGAWMATFDAAGLIADLEAELSIAIRG